MKHGNIFLEVHGVLGVLEGVWCRRRGRVPLVCCYPMPHTSNRPVYARVTDVPQIPFGERLGENVQLLYRIDFRKKCRGVVVGRVLVNGLDCTVL